MDTAPAPFIVGVPRSGTTLLRLMLDAHPQLAIPAETHFIPKLIRRLREPDAVAADDDEKRRIALELIVEHPRWEALGVERFDLERRLERSQPFAVSDAARAVHLVNAERAGKPRWGDKSPSYLRNMTRIEPVLPEARFIHLIRDGRDVALSLAEVSWGTSDVSEAAERWATEIRRGRRHAARLPEGDYLELRYEDLVADPEASLRRVCEAIELPFDPAMLAHEEGAAERLDEIVRDSRHAGGGAVSAAERAAQHRLAAEPTRGDRVGRWRREMSEADRRRFEASAGRLLERLGYPVGG
jgi:hypothetical protein